MTSVGFLIVVSNNSFIGSQYHSLEQCWTKGRISTAIADFRPTAMVAEV